MRRPVSAAIPAALACLLLLPVRALAAEPPPPCLGPPVVATVVDPFRSPSCRWCAGNRGLEYRTRSGQAVQAGATGTVSFVGPVAGITYVVVRHRSPESGELRTTYGGLSSVLVHPGQVVVAGQGLGRAGVRLFFGVRVGQRARYVDPAGYLVRYRSRARLVPQDGSAPRSSRQATDRRWTCTAREQRR